jgi:type VI secretion system secreted protein Hcp
VDLFLKLGDIKGEATDKRHREDIEVLSWSWGLSDTATTIRRGGGAGKPAFQNLHLRKYIDASSPKLLSVFVGGQSIPQGLLSVRNVAGTTIDFYQIELDEVRITSVSLGGSGGEDRPTEDLVLAFAKMRVAYFPTDKYQADTGTAFFWDIPAMNGDLSPVSSAGIAYIRYLDSQLTFTSGAPTISLAWPSVAGAVYRLRFSDRSDGPFQAYGDYPSAGDGTTTVVLPAASDKGFFLVEMLSSPSFQ